MTLDEAKKIGRIVAYADDGCADCVGKLLDDLNVQFPAFVWSYDLSKHYEEAVSVALAPMETRQGGDVKQAPSRSDDSGK